MSKLLFLPGAGATLANRTFRALFRQPKPEGELGVSTGTLVELLEHRAAQQGNRTAFSFLGDGRAPETKVTYAELAMQARSIAAELEKFAETGDRAVLLFPPGLEFIAAYFGCLYAGLAAVPAYPPHPARPEKSLAKLQAILGSSRPAAVLTPHAMQVALASLLEDCRPACSIVAVDRVEAAPQHFARGLRANESSLAMIQFTSGSTGMPRGVMVTHGALMHNLGLIQEAFGADRQSRGVFWLPFYHDMGLIGGVLETLYCGGSSTFLSPLSFVQQPLRWLETISRTQATISGGPNFAYEECLRRIDDKQLESLDLSHWRLAFCGAEPIHRETLNEFARKFARCGFRREALYGCYGMAEATLIISGGRFASSEAQSPNAAPAAPVSCGKPLGDVRVKIVNSETARPSQDGEPGEIWVASRSLGQGYWGRSQETQENFQATLGDGSGPYLRTGDLGFLKNGELYVAGRLKDMIIVGGANHYPQDIERTVLDCHEMLTGNGAAAFAIEVGRREGLAIVVEVSRQFARRCGEDPAAGELAMAIQTAIRQAVAQQHEISVDAIALVQLRSIPRTSSGKIQRRACRHAYLENTLLRVDRA